LVHVPKGKTTSSRFGSKKSNIVGVSREETKGKVQKTEKEMQVEFLIRNKVGSGARRVALKSKEMKGTQRHQKANQRP